MVGGSATAGGWALNIYNDVDPNVCAWAEQLVAAGHVAPGSVLSKSIKDVQADEIRHATQVHFFAGILGWPLALRLAGWNPAWPIWTGSCPCQPFSAAGKRKGTADERHLWPDMLRLIAECRPECVIGEQVASAVGHGWLDGVFADLEAEGYSCGAVVLGAHSVGAPHIRQRLFWVADAGSESGERRAGGLLAPQAGVGREDRPEHGDRAIRLADGREGGRLADAEGAEHDWIGSVTSGASSGLADGGWMGDTASSGRAQSDGSQQTGESREAAYWASSTTIPCGDGKARRIEPGISPLAHGIPARVVRLRGYGNAIVPQVAAAFIRAYIEARRQP